mgnify:CR=1 FL=1
MTVRTKKKMERNKIFQKTIKVVGAVMLIIGCLLILLSFFNPVTENTYLMAGGFALLIMGMLCLLGAKYDFSDENEKDQ